MAEVRPNYAGPIDLLRERVDAQARDTNEWLARVPEITDPETAKLCDDHIAKLNALIKDVDEARKDEQRPLRDALATIAVRYTRLQMMLSTAKDLISPLRTRWLEREQRRLDEEKAFQYAEAARLQQEALRAAQKAHDTVEGHMHAADAAKRAQEAATRAAEPPARAQVRGQYSARAASVRTLWRAEVVDPLLAAMYYRDHPDMLALLTKLGSAEASAAHKEGREIPGIKIVQVRSAS